MNVNAVIGRIPLLRRLSDADRERVARRSVVTAWGAGEALWRRGEAAETFHFIDSGRVRLNVVGNSRRPMALTFLDDGMLACAAAICQHTCYCCDAVVVSNARILTVPADVVLTEEQEGPLAAMLEAVSERTLLMCRRMREAAGARVSQRLGAILLRMADTEGRPAPDSRVRLTAVSREELAALCASTPETVVRILTDLTRDGLIEKQGGDLLVDTERLARAVRMVT